MEIAEYVYRDWNIRWDYGYYTAYSPNYDASYEGEEEGWVDNGEKVQGRTLTEVEQEIDAYILEHKPKAPPRLVIIESPYAGDWKANIIYARQCMKHSIQLGEAPIASHLLYTQPDILDDDIEEERNLGINLGLAWRRAADIICFYTDKGWSKGMLAAKELLEKEGRTYQIRSIHDSHQPTLLSNTQGPEGP